MLIHCCRSFSEMPSSSLCTSILCFFTEVQNADRSSVKALILYCPILLILGVALDEGLMLYYPPDHAILPLIKSISLKGNH